MTSEATKQQTSDFFNDHDYFGLNRGNVVIFEQFTLPCIDFDKKIILTEKYKVATAPGMQCTWYAQDKLLPAPAILSKILKIERSKILEKQRNSLHYTLVIFDKSDLPSIFYATLEWNLVV